MPTKERSTVGERLYWCYANLAMAEMAVDDDCDTYQRKHFMVRAKLYKGLMSGSMSPRSLMRDQAIRMRLPQECVYCESTQNLSIDHVIPSNRGGDDAGDNAIWACRSCNSAKSDKDIFEWWQSSRPGLPPLLVVRIYLKQAIRYFMSRNLMDDDWRSLDKTPFKLSFLPDEMPAPRELFFSPRHRRR